MYARVSDILSPMNDFSKIDPRVLEAKCSIGVSVHEVIEQDIKGEFGWPIPGGEGYFESYLRWKKRINPKFIQSEERYFDDELMITGQIDALADIDSVLRLPLLIDFKTSAQESKETWPMQAHLYSYLLNKNGMVVHPKQIFIKLDKNGFNPHVFEYLWSLNTLTKCKMAIEEFWKKNNV